MRVRVRVCLREKWASFPKGFYGFGRAEDQSGFINRCVIITQGEDIRATEVK